MGFNSIIQTNNWYLLYEATLQNISEKQGIFWYINSTSLIHDCLGASLSKESVFMNSIHFCLSNAHDSTQRKSWIQINHRNVAISGAFVVILILEIR